MVDWAFVGIKLSFGGTLQVVVGPPHVVNGNPCTIRVHDNLLELLK